MHRLPHSRAIRTLALNSVGDGRQQCTAACSLAPAAFTTVPLQVKHAALGAIFDEFRQLSASARDLEDQLLTQFFR